MNARTNPLQRGYYRSEPKYLYESVMTSLASSVLFVVAAFCALPTAATIFGGVALLLGATTLYRAEIDTYRR